MSADVIQVQYETLQEIARQFGSSSEGIEALRAQLARGVAALQDGGWTGQGAVAFSAEMESEIFPAVQRLSDALQEAQTISFEISEVVRKAEEEAAKLFQGETAAAPPKEEGGGGLWGAIGEWVHGGLDVIGLIPGVGEIADGINAVIYLAEGRYLEAGISAAAMIPILGDLGKAGKWGVKGAKAVLGEVVEEGAERVVREGAEELAERGAREAGEAVAERNTRRVAETAADRAARDTAARNAADQLGRRTDINSPDSQRLIQEVADNSTNAAHNADRVVLGKWETNPTTDPSTWGYVEHARNNGGVWYQTADGVYDAMKGNPDAVWAVNERFLRDQLGSGVQRFDFVSGDVMTVLRDFPNTARGREVQFLLDNAGNYGYTRVGNSWVRSDLLPTP